MEENKLIKNNLKYYLDLADSDVYGGNDTGFVYVNIYKQDNRDVGITAFFELSWDRDNFEFEWEADGEPTYVPYGNTSVMYDDGRGGLDYVVAYAECDDYYFIELDVSADDGTKLTKEQVSQILGCSEEELDHLMVEIEEKVISYAEDQLVDYYKDSDNWPDRSYYESWYDCDWD